VALLLPQLLLAAARPRPLAGAARRTGRLSTAVAMAKGKGKAKPEGDKPLAVHWFRRGLRLHDNPALLEALDGGSAVLPVYIADPAELGEDVIGTVRQRFLLQSLVALNTALAERGSELLVLRGSAEDVMPRLLRSTGAALVTWEYMSEPAARRRDTAVASAARDASVEVGVGHSHTLHELEGYDGLAGASKPKTYQSFIKLFNRRGAVPAPLDAPGDMPPVEASLKEALLLDLGEGAAGPEQDFGVPTLAECGYDEAAAADNPVLYPGGEAEGLERMALHLANVRYIATFEKPKTKPNALAPATTVLSPYITHGCISARRFWHGLAGVYAEAESRKIKVAQPPVSLHGQMLFREYFYYNSVATRHFGEMVDNPSCYQIPWDDTEEKLAAWEEGRTGFPFIDAIMTQLRQEGWVHHLARHAVACFLTRGDLFQHWERGAEVFEKLLIDADWALNRANWQWLSASRFFHQYFRVYSPISFGMKTDKSGAYIRKYLPQLAKFPDRYIYEPWKAPRAVQEAAGCVIGVDYPEPIVPDHTLTSKRNQGRMKEAYAARKAGADILEQKGWEEPPAKRRRVVEVERTAAVPSGA